MYANTCWGLLGLAVTFGLAVLCLPQDYLWLQPYFIWTAVACGIASVICFLWPLLRRSLHLKTESKLGPTVIVVGVTVVEIGLGIWFLESRDSKRLDAVSPNPLVKNADGPPIEWRFDKPVTLFWYSRKPGEAVRIEAV